MYYHEAMKEPDYKEFVKAMKKEIIAHTDNQGWKVVAKYSIPLGQQILPAVWAMKRKRRIATQEAYKWKASLNIDGYKQTEGVNYWEIFSPVATWPTIRFVFIMALINQWETRKIDFVLAYIKVEVECELYMSIPKGFEVKDRSKEYFY
jgi:Reverse transcriptase (RNA-dependent DNA polymerase)